MNTTSNIFETTLDEYIDHLFEAAANKIDISTFIEANNTQRLLTNLDPLDFYHPVDVENDYKRMVIALEIEDEDRFLDSLYEHYANTRDITDRIRRTDEEIIVLGRKFKHMTDFKFYDPSAHVLMHIRGLRDQVSINMVRGYKGNRCKAARPAGHARTILLTEEYCLSIASSYPDKKSLMKNDESVYRKILKLNLQDKAFAHFKGGRAPLDFERIHQLAKQCRSRKEFHRRFNRAYRKAGELGIRDIVCQHMSC